MEERRLEEICESDESGGFSIMLLGNHYCSLKPSKKIDCKYRAEYKDQNNCYVCLHPKFNKNDYLFDGIGIS